MFVGPWFDGRMAPELPARVRLSRSGLTATLEHDSITESGVVLTIGAAEQSHVEAQDPAFLLHDYLRRMRSVLTALEASRGSGLGPLCTWAPVR
ncbi:hypothetical protein [Nesterenkonia pannonica]|uniref:hypothetical protein n=1 Tax=Nesterenkonia pannonica TaxID=1548602 RepID=UPI002164CC14|nr:hypothetical protein [Nesterenkonia pannonica]